MAIMVLSAVRGQVPEPDLPRPGAVVVSSLLGEAFMIAGDVRRPLKPDDRLRVGVTLTTGRRSMLLLLLSNGASIELDSESEIELEEFGQLVVSSSLKIQDLKEEPTVSRTRLRLVRGAVTIDVKPLKVARGSSFILGTPAGNLRTGAGTARAMVRMSDLGLGICSIELQKGAAEFEPPGKAFSPLPAGRNFTYALEIEKATGAIKVGELLPPMAPKP